MKKEIVFIIEYRMDISDIYIEEALEKLRETGSAEIVDVRVEDMIKEKKK